MTEQNTEPKIGEEMPDDTIYAGISPDTGKKMYVMPDDEPLTMTFNQATEYAGKLNAEKFLSHDDWQVPTKAELNVLFNNRAAIGGFNVSGSYPAGWYWSATPSNPWSAWCQRFSDGGQFYNYDGPPLADSSASVDARPEMEDSAIQSFGQASVRLVRTAVSHRQCEKGAPKPI